MSSEKKWVTFRHPLRKFISVWSSVLNLFVIVDIVLHIWSAATFSFSRPSVAKKRKSPTLTTQPYSQDRSFKARKFLLLGDEVHKLDSDPKIKWISVKLNEQRN